MDGQDISAIIGALGGSVVTVVTMLFVQRRKNKLLSNTQNVNNFQVLFDEVRKDINRLRDEQADERKQWADERKSFNSKIDKLNELIRNQAKALHSKELEVTKLQGQVNLLQSQLDTYREIHSVSKNVTIKT